MKIQKLIPRYIFCALAIFLFNLSAAFADTSTTLKYQVSVTKLELYNSDTGQWVTVYNPSGSTSSTMDIASVNSGQSAGAFLSSLAVPDGSYTKCRVTPSVTFVIKGSVLSGATTYYTTAATATSGGRTVAVASTTASDLAECTIVNLSADVAPPDAGDSFSGTLKITNGVADHRVRVNFDLSNSLAYDGAGHIYPQPPTVTTTLVAS